MLQDTQMGRSRVEAITAMGRRTSFAPLRDVARGMAQGLALGSSLAPMMRETAAFYLLGVQVEDGDRNGEAQRIEVKVNQRGASVRNRATVVIPKKAS